MKRIFSLAALIPALFVGASVHSAEVTRELALMGTVLRVESQAPTHALALEASEAGIRAAEATEQRLSTWKSDSELSRLNHSEPGKPFLVSPTLRSELSAAEHWSRETDYAFHFGIGGLIQAWNLRVFPPSARKIPTPARIASALRAMNPSHFKLGATSATRLDLGFQIEEGGFGKGAGLDEALRAMTDQGATSVLLNLGGQIALSPERETTVAISHPQHRAQLLYRLSVRGGSVSTSGTSERGHHIIDPRTGGPVEYSGSVSVWARNATQADILSTAFFVMGPKKALHWARKHPGIEAVFLDPDGKAKATCGLRERLRPERAGLETDFDCGGIMAENRKRKKGHSL